MAGAAISVGRGVFAWLALGNAAVVAVDAITEHVVVVDAGNWTPRRRAMAIDAKIISARMPDRLAGGEAAVVATHAVGAGSGMVESGRQPSPGTVAGVALSRCRDMGDGLARRTDTVVTGVAGAG